MDLSLSLKKAKLGERKTGRTRKKRRCKKTDRSSRKSSNSPTRCDAAIRKSTQRPAARSFYCNDRNWKRSRDSIRRSCVNRSKRTARKIVISGIAVSSTNDSYMSILNWEAVVPFSSVPLILFLQKVSQIFAFALIVLIFFCKGPFSRKWKS